MRLLALNLENFRNVEAAQLSFSGLRTFFYGPNGEGKTNLLEAIGFAGVLRSFRFGGVDNLVRHEASEARLFHRFLDHKDNESEVLLCIDSKGAKTVELDGEKITRLADYVGRFPSVALSSRDFRLVRDGPGERRRWLDVTLSSSSPTYFEILRTFHRALRERNALLKRDGSDPELDAFEASLVPSAAELTSRRREALPRLSAHLAEHYATLTNGREQASLQYRPNLEETDTESMAERYLAAREGDRIVGSTRRGPHRDDFRFLLDSRDARNLASEGQQRGLVLALRLAEFAFLREACETTPILLLDDALGELDAERKANFRSLLPEDAQVFASGTIPPGEADDSGEWETFEVSAGSFHKS
ncbi:MAG: DNA replication/repair protein RecF [Opitutales bacterium]